MGKKITLDSRIIAFSITAIIVLAVSITGFSVSNSKKENTLEYEETSSIPKTEESSKSSSTHNEKVAGRAAASSQTSENIDTIKSTNPEVATLEEVVLYNDIGITMNRHTSVNEIFHIVNTDDMFWTLVRGDDGTEGYIYSDYLHYVGEEGIKPTSALTETVKDKLSELREIFPDGKFWNHIGIPEDEISPLSVTDIPCEHLYDYNFYDDTYYFGSGDSCNEYSGSFMNYYEYTYGYDALYQCLGFANYVSDYIFGDDAPVFANSGIDGIKVGDHLRLLYYDHSVIVTKIQDDGINVLEVNQDFEDCQIEWDRFISFEELALYDYDGLEYLTRY